jgi:hypothetical protein
MPISFFVIRIVELLFCLAAGAVCAACHWGDNTTKSLMVPGKDSSKWMDLFGGFGRYGTLLYTFFAGPEPRDRTPIKRR